MSNFYRVTWQEEDPSELGRVWQQLLGRHRKHLRDFASKYPPVSHNKEWGRFGSWRLRFPRLLSLSRGPPVPPEQPLVFTYLFASASHTTTASSELHILRLETSLHLPYLTINVDYDGGMTHDQSRDPSTHSVEGTTPPRAIASEKCLTLPTPNLSDLWGTEDSWFDLELGSERTKTGPKIRDTSTVSPFVRWVIL